MVPRDLEFLEDPSRSVSFDTVQSRPFMPVPSAKPSFGYSASAYWLRFTLDSADQSEVWIELVSLIDSIEMYASAPSGGIVRLKTGRMEPLRTRPVAHRNFVFPLRLEKGTTHVYFRFVSSGSMLSEKDAAQREALEMQRRMTESFERFVPAEFLALLGKPDVASVRAGDAVRRELAVLFADIRDFTSMSEKMSPEENFRFINACLRRIGPVIRQNGGFVDKYIGDAIMALFPSATAAVEAAFCHSGRG